MSDARAVTFDFGQTLAEVDTDLLARRLAERGVACAPDALARATTAAWRAPGACMTAWTLASVFRLNALW